MTGSTMQDTTSCQTCLVCNSRLTVSSRGSCNIFGTEIVMLGSGQSLSTKLGSVVGMELSESHLHTSIVCRKCFRLLSDLDSLEARVETIRLDIQCKFQDSWRLHHEAKDESAQNSVEVTCDVPVLVKEDGAEGVSSVGGKGHAVKKGRPPRKKTKPVKIETEAVAGDEASNTESHDLQDGGGESSSPEKDDVIPVPAQKRRRKKSEENQSGSEGRILVKEEEEKQEEYDGVDVEDEEEDDVEDVDGEVEEEIESDAEAEGLKFQFKCKVCEKQFVMARSLMDHSKCAHELKLYLCDLCPDEEFGKKSELSRHLEAHAQNGEKPFWCKVCRRNFQWPKQFKEHLRGHLAKSHKCETCGKKFNSKRLLEEHHNIHTGVRPYQCGVCEKNFASKYCWKVHMKIHSVRPRPYNCKSCSKSFLNAHHLQEHEKTHSGQKNYICETCGKAFGTARNLEVHSVVHTGYKPHTCNVCGKSFARRAEIVDHERIHTGEKPFQCELCGATFSQRSNLQSHKRATHYDDKRYKCEQCGKGFKRRRLLDYHMKSVHTGERPYKCNLCNAGFVYPEHYKKHLRIHTGEKPYKCEICGKAFNSRDNRNAHRFIHSEKKPYECKVCGQGFMRKPTLFSHMQTARHMEDTIIVNRPQLPPTQPPEEDVAVKMILPDTLNSADIIASTSPSKDMVSFHTHPGASAAETAKVQVVLAPQPQAQPQQQQPLSEAGLVVDHMIVEGLYHHESLPQHHHHQLAIPTQMVTNNPNVVQVTSVPYPQPQQQQPQGQQQISSVMRREDYNSVVASATAAAAASGTVQVIHIRQPPPGAANRGWLNYLNQP